MLTHHFGGVDHSNAYVRTYTSVRVNPNYFLTPGMAELGPTQCLDPKRISIRNLHHLRDSTKLVQPPFLQTNLFPCLDSHGQRQLLPCVPQDPAVPGCRGVTTSQGKQSPHHRHPHASQGPQPRRSRPRTPATTGITPAIPIAGRISPITRPLPGRELPQQALPPPLQPPLPPNSAAFGLGLVFLKI